VIVSTTQHITVYRQTIDGRPGTGKVSADFTVLCLLAGATSVLSVTATERGTIGTARAYDLAFTAPATVGDIAIRVVPTSGTDTIFPDLFADVVTNYSIDSLAALVATPIVSVINAGTPTSDISLRLVKDDYAPLTFTVRDQSGAAIDISGYTSPTFAVLDRAQTVVSRYVQTTGITLSALGLATIEVPEAASFYGFLTPVGTDSVTLYFTLKGNQAGDAAKTRTLARGTLTVLRTETA
jgi:hypothetical protein